MKLNVVEQLPELIGPAFVYNRENKMIPFYFFCVGDGFIISLFIDLINLKNNDNFKKNITLT